jgi:hypothetical protein
MGVLPVLRNRSASCSAVVAGGLFREVFPVVGGEFVDAAVGVCGDAGQRMAQAGEGGESVSARAGDKAEVDGCGVSAAVSEPGRSQFLRPWPLRFAGRAAGGASCADAVKNAPPALERSAVHPVLTAVRSARQDACHTRLHMRPPPRSCPARLRLPDRLSPRAIMNRAPLWPAYLSTPAKPARRPLPDPHQRA